MIMESIGYFNIVNIKLYMVWFKGFFKKYVIVGYFWDFVRRNGIIGYGR